MKTIIFISTLLFFISCMDSEKKVSSGALGEDMEIAPVPEVADVVPDTGIAVLDKDGNLAPGITTLAEATAFARNAANYESIVYVDGKALLAQGSIVIPFNTQPKTPGDQVESIPLYDSLDNAYKDYYRKQSSNSYTTIGPGGRGWHITYVYPIDLIKHEYKKDVDVDWWRDTAWPQNLQEDNEEGRPLLEELFVKVGIDGKRDLYMHSDFVKELILLKDVADLHHFVKKTNTYTVKDKSEKTYDEMAHISLWGKDMPDGSETHPEDAAPAPFIKKPGTATYKSENGVPYDLAPSWMEDGKKYYTFDYHYFYDDIEKMGQNIAQDKHDLAVNSNTPYINIYNFIHAFKAGAYTVDEIYEYIDYRIDDSQQSKSSCEVSLLAGSDSLPADWKTANEASWSSCKDAKPPHPSQINTFKNMVFESGGEQIENNPAIMIAVSEGESGFGRSSEAHADADPFNYGGPYQNVGGTDCDFCCDLTKCAKAPSLGVICTECCNACIPSLTSTNQGPMTEYVIKTWPLFWNDSVLKGKKKIPAFGFKGGGIAQGYNPSLYWGPHMAAKYYKLDMWHGFCEKKRIYNNADPSGSEALVFLNPSMKSDPSLNTYIKDNSNLTSYPCPNSY